MAQVIVITLLIGGLLWAAGMLWLAYKNAGK
jgi:hypothetical protein